jgi:glycosyltransferase involved in cell wall biosynthesis
MTDSAVLERPAISLIIPSYNRGAKILPTLRSVLEQTLSVQEIIVVNDGASVDTREAVASLDAGVSVIDQPQSGAAEARNVGARHAVCPVVMFLDDDDRLHPFAVEALIDCLIAFPAAKAAFCDHTFTDLTTGEHRSNHFHLLDHYARFRALVPDERRDPNLMLFGRQLHDALLLGNLLVQPWMIWKDTYMALGGFVSNLGSADDWDLYLRLTRHYKVAVVDRVASDHFREVGRVHLTTADGQEETQVAVAIRQLRAAGRLDFMAQRCLRRKVGLHYKSAGDRERLSNPRRARLHYFRSLRWWPLDPVVAIRAVFPRL